MKSRLILCAGALLVASLVRPIDAAAAVLVLSDGELIGATGVLVSGQSYDVTFVDGTCAELFGGCDAISDFPFPTEADALGAAKALMDQVFTGIHDTDPALTRGCQSGEYCLLSTPYTLTSGGMVLVAALLNSSESGVDQAVQFGTFAGVDYTDYPTFAYSIWSRVAAPSTIPEPGTLALLSLGLLGLGDRTRRQLVGSKRRPLNGRPGA